MPAAPAFPVWILIGVTWASSSSARLQPAAWSLTGAAACEPVNPSAAIRGRGGGGGVQKPGSSNYPSSGPGTSPFLCFTPIDLNNCYRNTSFRGPAPFYWCFENTLFRAPIDAFLGPLLLLWKCNLLFPLFYLPLFSPLIITWVGYVHRWLKVKKVAEILLYNCALYVSHHWTLVMICVFCFMCPRFMCLSSLSYTCPQCHLAIVKL